MAIKSLAIKLDVHILQVSEDKMKLLIPVMSLFLTTSGFAANTPDGEQLLKAANASITNISADGVRSWHCEIPRPYTRCWSLNKNRSRNAFKD